MSVFEFILIDEHSEITLMTGERERFSCPAEFLETVLGQGFQHKRGTYPGVEVFVSNQDRDGLIPNLVGSYFAATTPIRGPVIILHRNCGKLPENLMEDLDKVLDAFVKISKQGKTFKSVGADEWLKIQLVTMS